MSTKAELKSLKEVRELMQLYIDGSNGDVEKLTKAFHPDAQMFGQYADNPFAVVPMTDFIPAVGEYIEPRGATYEVIVRSIDITGDAGVAVLVETDYLGYDFVNYFVVARFDGEWKITNKTYAEMGLTSTAG